MKKLIVLMLVILTTASCSKANTPVESKVAITNVLVVINDNSATSKEVGQYYAEKRGIDAKYVLHIKCPESERVPVAGYVGQIEKPVKAFVRRQGVSIDYIVLTKGIPFIIRESEYSVDSVLSAMDAELDPGQPKGPLKNPYFDANGHFSHAKYGLYLVTRIDGFTKEDAKALVDHAVAARPQKGIFLLDISPSWGSGAYKDYNDDMRKASEILKARGYVTTLDTAAEFVGKRNNLMGYCSWGSNDPAFDKEKYRGNRFLPGAIAETAVSTSARTFAPKETGQSLIGDLIKSGVTGIKGYCSEPQLDAIAQPSILFDRYVSGYNLAESFYMASRIIYWKDIVVGDPLVSPYAKGEEK